MKVRAIRNAVEPPGKDSTLGSRIHWARTYLGLSLEEFAEQIVSPRYYRRVRGRTIERWEKTTTKGLRKSISLIGAIADHAGIDPSWLAFGHGSPFGMPCEPGVYVTQAGNSTDSELEVWARGGRRLLRMHVSQRVIDDSGLVAALYEWFSNYDPPPVLSVIPASGQ